MTHPRASASGTSTSPPVEYQWDISKRDKWYSLDLSAPLRQVPADAFDGEVEEEEGDGGAGMDDDDSDD